MKIGQAVSEKKVFKYYMILYNYIAQGQGLTGDKISIVTKASLTIHSKIHPLVLNTFLENDMIFQYFPHTNA